MTVGEFIDMGGHGPFVWSAYAIWLVVMIINYVQPILRERKTINNLLKRHGVQSNKT